MPVEIRHSLTDVIRSDIGEPRRVGRRSYWCCPFHDDKHPSLTLTPEGNHFKCFGCGQHGDAIDWVMLRKGVTFKEAVCDLGGALDDFFSGGEVATPIKPGPKSPQIPDAEWSAQAEQIATKCVQQLHARMGEKARRWLIDRGIELNTILEWKLGFNPEDRYLHGLFVHRGITIPWFEGGSFRVIKIRRPHLEPKYVCVPGSCPSGLFLSQTIRPGIPTLVVEGEFDAILGWQELLGHVNVVTLGSASLHPDQWALTDLVTSPLVLVCYDNDEAGKAGERHWMEASGRVRAISVPRGKDLTDFFLEGGDVKPWIEGILREYGVETTRHPTLGHNDKSGTEIPVGFGTRQHPTLSGI